MPEVLVCKDGEIKDGDVRLIRVGREEIGVIRHRDNYYAYRNLCPHQGGPACEGLRMPQVVDRIGDGGILLGQTFDEDDMHIVCPWHGYEFDVLTGEHPVNAAMRLTAVPVRVADGEVFVTVPAQSGRDG